MFDEHGRAAAAGFDRPAGTAAGSRGLQADRQARAAALRKAVEWVRYSDKARRETNTMPQWAGSCWYYLRYIDPHNHKLPWDSEKERYWMPVDLYIGGAEHAVLHLLYSRFWHKVLFDRGWVSTPEPFPQAGQPGDDPG